MKDAVLIKSNHYGITIRFHPDMDFDVLLQEVAGKFKATAHFFNHAEMAVAYEGRTFTKEEEQRMTETIQDAAKIRILCLMEQDKEKEQVCRQLIDKSLHKLHANDGLFYKGTLRKREKLEAESSIVIIGDVEEHATVISDGNVVVAGGIYGMVTAGASGNLDAQIAALSMKPQRLRIANIEVKPIIGGSYSWAKLL